MCVHAETIRIKRKNLQYIQTARQTNPVGQTFANKCHCMHVTNSKEKRKQVTMNLRSRMDKSPGSNNISETLKLRREPKRRWQRVHVCALGPARERERER